MTNIYCSSTSDGGENQTKTSRAMTNIFCLSTSEGRENLIKTSKGNDEHILFIHYWRLWKSNLNIQGQWPTSIVHPLLKVVKIKLKYPRAITNIYCLSTSEAGENQTKTSKGNDQHILFIHFWRSLRSK